MYIHSLPFNVDYNGQAEVELAFPVLINKDPCNYESSFRGRKLGGRIHELSSTLTILCGNIDKASKKLFFETRDPSIENKIEIIEWTKVDVPEPSKCEIGNFSKMLNLQNKINHMFN